MNKKFLIELETMPDYAEFIVEAKDKVEAKKLADKELFYNKKYKNMGIKDIRLICP